MIGPGQHFSGHINPNAYHRRATGRLYEVFESVLAADV